MIIQRNLRLSGPRRCPEIQDIESPMLALPGSPKGIRFTLATNLPHGPFGWPLNCVELVTRSVKGHST